MTIAAAILAILMLPVDIPEDCVSLIEVNYVYCENGAVCLSQIVFVDFADEPPYTRVVAWRLWPDPTKSPSRNQRTGNWELVWHDGSTLRRVIARYFRVTHTRFDPEIENRAVWPQSQQRGLTQRKAPPSP